MARDRDERFSGARDFIEALRGRAIVGAPSGEEAESSKRDPRKLWIFGGLAAALLSVVAGVVLVGSGALSGDQSVKQNEPAEFGATNIGGRSPVDHDGGAPSKVAAAQGVDASHQDSEALMVSSNISVRLAIEPADAQVYLNGKLVGTPVDEMITRLEGEELNVRVEAKGYHEEHRTFPRTKDITDSITLKRAAGRVKNGARPGRKKGGNFKTGIF